MTMPAQKLDRRMTYAEYVAFEQTARERHEFIDGEVLAMSGGTYDHSGIKTSLTALLRARLGGTGCRVRDSDMRVGLADHRRTAYPDASIVCGPPSFDPQGPRQTTLLNPRVIFEVLSDSTERYDRTDKFNFYLTIPSLDEYLLIAHHRPRVEGYLRQGDGTWSMAVWDGVEATARVRCLNIDLPLAELYEGVMFVDAAE